ncbi:MAG: hypothetical protein QM762_14850 [Chryseolinea sp.]
MIAVIFAKAGKNRGGSNSWGFIGLIYYGIGRITFSLLLYAGYKLFSTQQPDFRIYKGLVIVELFGGMTFAVFTAYVLGEISGLNIKRIFNRD